MKKTILAALCISALLLTACGNSKKPAEETTASETTAVSSESTSGEETETSGMEEFTEGVLTGTLSAIGDSIEKVGEWPMLETIDDKDMFTTFTGLDMENPNYKNVYFRHASMSAAFGEYIIIEADDVDAAVKDLEARRDKLIEVDAFYPEHKDLAEQAIVGKKGNYAYLIARENPSEVETELLTQLP